MTRTEILILQHLRHRRPITLHRNPRGHLIVYLPWAPRTLAMKQIVDATLALVGKRYAEWGDYRTTSGGRDTAVRLSVAGCVFVDAMLAKRGRAA